MTNNSLAFWQASGRIGVRALETVHGAGEVVAQRMHVIMEATRDPLNGDYAELGRMIPEKIEALSQSSLSMLTDMLAIQSQMMSAWWHWRAALLSGQAASPTAWSEASIRSRRIARRLTGSGGRALAPVHRRVTANAKRLKGR